MITNVIHVYVILLFVFPYVNLQMKIKSITFVIIKIIYTNNYNERPYFTNHTRGVVNQCRIC